MCRRTWSANSRTMVCEQSNMSYDIFWSRRSGRYFHLSFTPHSLRHFPPPSTLMRPSLLSSNLLYTPLPSPTSLHSRPRSRSALPSTLLHPSTSPLHLLVTCNEGLQDWPQCLLCFGLILCDVKVRDVSGTHCCGQCGYNVFAYGRCK